jgi:PPOX class probable F420-dependent enzyme
MVRSARHAVIGEPVNAKETAQMRTGLTPDDLADFLQEPLVAVLATRRLDDSILLSPVWFEWRDGGINVWASSADDGKVRHILRDPRVSIVIANSVWPYKGVEIRGRATVSSEGFTGVLERTARHYFGRERGDAMVAAITTPGVVLRIEGDVRAWDYADEA